MNPYRISIIGNYAVVEINVDKQKHFRFYGGAAYNIAVACAVAGHLPTGIACIGGDFDCDRLTTMLPEVTTLVDNGTSCKFVYNIESALQEPTIYTNIGAGQRINEIPLLRLISFSENADWLHICCHRPLNPHRIVSLINCNQIPMSLSFVRSSLVEQLAFVRPFIRKEHWVFFNEAEYEIAARQKILPSCNIVCTLGAIGSRIIFLDDMELFSPLKSTRTVVDSTAAGDCFVAGFITAILEGLNKRDALERGNSYGGIAVSELGVGAFEKILIK